MTDYPCDTCNTRQYYARAFDIHFCGADCPYECELYDEWKKEQGYDNRPSDKPAEATVIR